MYPARPRPTLRRSKKRSARICAPCHGYHGEGGRGPNLAAGRFYHGSTDPDLFNNITTRIPGTLSVQNFTPTGDARRGAKLYEAQGCARCHRIDGSGLGPALLPNIEPSPEGTYIWPGVQGATNWYSPSYNPETKLFYLSYWENRSVYRIGDQEYTAGNRNIGNVPLIDLPEDLGGIRALNSKTGAKIWEYKLQTKPWAGVLSTGGGLVFGGSDEGYFFALGAATGKELWRRDFGGIIRANPVTYLVDGKRMATIAAGNTMFTFGA